MCECMCLDYIEYIQCSQVGLSFAYKARLHTVPPETFVVLPPSVKVLSMNTLRNRARPTVPLAIREFSPRNAILLLPIRESFHPRTFPAVRYQAQLSRVKSCVVFVYLGMRRKMESGSHL